MPHTVICPRHGIVPSLPCRQCEHARNNASPYHSRRWKRTRRAVIASHGGECAICASTDRLTVHHGTNRNVDGNDTPTDKKLLCQACHSKYEADRRAGKDTELRRLVEA